MISLTLGVAAQPAIGSPEFPRVVRETLNLSQAPGCTLCHGQGQTGFGTVSTTFGTAMLSAGVLPGNDDSIRAALLTLRDEGSPLISDLIAGRDPNLRGRDPKYGCGSNVAPFEPMIGLALGWVLSLQFCRRRRRPTAPP